MRQTIRGDTAEVVRFPAPTQARRTARTEGATPATILLFTGVRYERRDEPEARDAPGRGRARR